MHDPFQVTKKTATFRCGPQLMSQTGKQTAQQCLQDSHYFLRVNKQDEFPVILPKV